PDPAPASAFGGRPSGPAGQHEAETRALARLALGPDLAAVALHHPPHRRQRDAVAGELVLGVQALERPEQLGRVFLAEACTVVAHEAHRLVPLVRRAADLDPRIRGVRGELPGVADQVLQQVAHQVRITVRAQAGLHDYFHLAPGLG